MATQCSSASTGMGSTTAPEIVEVLECTRAPDVWCNYNLVKMSDGSTKAHCKHCGKFLKPESNTTLRVHTLKYCQTLKTVPETSQNTMARDGTIFAYNADRCREQFANFVIQEALPFQHFDNPRLTRMIQATLQPRYNHIIFDNVADVDASKESWNIRVKVLLRWKQTYKNNPKVVSSLDMILMDQHGTKIQATIKKNLISDFENVLEEGSVRVISNFAVGSNSGSYILVNHPCKLNFYKSTKVKISTDFADSVDLYIFPSFNDLLMKNLDICCWIGSLH